MTDGGGNPDIAVQAKLTDSPKTTVIVSSIASKILGAAKKNFRLIALRRHCKNTKKLKKIIVIYIK